MTLQYFRKMGSMEQIFTIFNDRKINAWGPAAGIQRVNGLSQIPLDRFQAIWNRLHSKYQSFQCQFLTVTDTKTYDDIYIGCKPFNVIRYEHGEIDIFQILKREMNHRFILLNDLNLSAEDISNHKYHIDDIPPVYRLFLVDDWWCLNINHAIADGMGISAITHDLLLLLNGEEIDDTLVPYTNVEQCIDPKLRSSSFTNTISNAVPTKWAMRFGKMYSESRCLRKYNPLSLHRDDLLRFQFYFSDQYLTFPLEPVPNPFDYSIDIKHFKLSKLISENIKQHCKAHKVHMSSLLQYLSTEALIECHGDQLKDDEYRTMMNNVFSTIPMYTKQSRKSSNGIYLGVHSCAYLSVMEWRRNVKINSTEFWEILKGISAQVLEDGMVSKVYKGKFPYINLKELMNYILTTRDSIFGTRSLAAPTLTNPGVMRINKKGWKHKLTDFIGTSNPGVGMGSMYLLSAITIKGQDRMQFGFIYGPQILPENMAQDLVTRFQEKLEYLGSLKLQLASKL